MIVDMVGTLHFNSFILLLGVIVALYSVKSSRVIARKRQTADAILKMQHDSRRVDSLKRIRELHENDECNIRSYGKIDRRDSTELADILYVLNYYEFVAVGICEGIFDDKMWKRANYSTVDKLWERVFGLVAELRMTRNQETMYQELEELVTRWRRNPLKIKSAYGRNGK